MLAWFGRKIIFLAVSCVLAAVLVVYLFWQAILTGALESSIGVPVKLGHIRFHLFPLELGLNNIQVRNVHGFESKNLASIPEIYFRMQTGELLRGKIHINEIRINIEEITVERNMQGKINLAELQKKLKEISEPNKEASPKPGKKSKAKPLHLQIDKAVLTMERVQYIDHNFTPPVSKVFFVNIYQAALQDVTNPQRVTEQIITIALQKIGTKIVTSQINQAAGAIAEQARASLSGLFGKKTSP